MKNIQYITAFSIGLAACTPSNNNFAINERSMVDRETVIENSIVLSNNEKYSLILTFVLSIFISCFLFIQY